MQLKLKIIEEKNAADFQEAVNNFLSSVTYAYGYKLDRIEEGVMQQDGGALYTAFIYYWQTFEHSSDPEKEIMARMRASSDQMQKEG